MSFYCFRQNNSGGSFVVDEERGISVEVWIEAPSAEIANARAEAIGLYFDGRGDCACCGSRWGSAYESDGQEDAPTEVTGYTDWTEGKPMGYLHRFMRPFEPLPFRQERW